MNIWPGVQLMSFKFNFSRIWRGLVFSWVCIINACLVRLHPSCDFSANLFSCPLFTAVVSRDQCFFFYSVMNVFYNVVKYNTSKKYTWVNVKLQILKVTLKSRSTQKSYSITVMRVNVIHYIQPLDAWYIIKHWNLYNLPETWTCY